MSTKIAIILTAIDKASGVINKATKNARTSVDIAKKAALVGTGISGLLALPLKAAADMERMNIALRTSFQGNEQAANKAFKTINDFAAKTPYDLQEVMTGFIKLKNMGLDPSQTALTAYGNTASAMGKSLNDMVEAVADAATGEFERLKEFGIKANSTKDQVTFTFQGVKTTVGKNAKEIEGYLKKLGNTKFAGGIDAQSKSMYGQLSTLKDNAMQVAAKLGNTLLPQVNRLFEKITPLFEKISQWVDKNPDLTATIMKLAAAGAILSFGISGLAFVTGGYFKILASGTSVFKAVKAGMLAYKTAMLAGTTVTGGLSAALKAMSLSALPWLIAIAGAAYLIYKNWGTIKKFFTNVWETIKGPLIGLFNIIKAVFLNFTPLGIVIKHWGVLQPYFQKLWEVIKTVFLKVWTGIKFVLLNFTPYGLIFKHWDKIKPYFQTVVNGIKNVFYSLPTFINNLGDLFLRAGKNIVISIWKGIKAMVSLPITAIKTIVTKLREYLPFSPAKVGPLKDIHKIKLVETIAATIKPMPMVKAMSRAVSAVARTPMSSTRPAQLPSNISNSKSSVTFSPVINLSGGATQNDANVITSALKSEFRKLIKDHEANKARLAY